jgi:cyclopropane fatty-acyl-phospholipid synthase-like methyltransferase
MGIMRAYAGFVRNDHAAQWEELARRDASRAVLTNDGTADAGFFESGEADLSALLATIASVLSREIALTSALDFGCGAGRLTLPLARRAGHVVACDLAPTMLIHARRNAERAGLHNITFLPSEGIAALSFDFVCSLLVFQYIAPSDGHVLIAALIGLLVPGGIAALHVTFGRPGANLRRLARMRLARRTSTASAQEEAPLAYLQIREYDERVVLQTIEAAGGRLVARIALPQGETDGAVMVIEKMGMA